MSCWKPVLKGTLLSMVEKDKGYKKYTMLYFHGTKILVGNIKNKNKMEPGQVGTLYQFDLGFSKKNSWFQWIPIEKH